VSHLLEEKRVQAVFTTFLSYAYEFWGALNDTEIPDSAGGLPSQGGFLGDIIGTLFESPQSEALRIFWHWFTFTSPTKRWNRGVKITKHAVTDQFVEDWPEPTWVVFGSKTSVGSISAAYLPQNTSAHRVKTVVRHRIKE
jgi:hypothetical protein